ncbi:hypothetical protein B0H13DRAFT_2557119 [Mycena leptocephala]|nr:hypothetical protein B0H13DRAFT_2557119 [Mycena leptocephala]
MFIGLVAKPINNLGDLFRIATENGHIGSALIVVKWRDKSDVQETKQRAIRLVESVKDSHSDIRTAAIESLARLTGHAAFQQDIRLIIPSLIQSLRDSKVIDRRAVFECFSCLTVQTIFRLDIWPAIYAIVDSASGLRLEMKILISLGNESHEICLLYILDSIAKAKMGREIAIPVVSELLTATADCEDERNISFEAHCFILDLNPGHFKSKTNCWGWLNYGPGPEKDFPSPRDNRKRARRSAGRREAGSGMLDGTPFTEPHRRHIQSHELDHRRGSTSIQRVVLETESLWADFGRKTSTGRFSQLELELLLDFDLKTRSISGFNWRFRALQCQSSSSALAVCLCPCMLRIPPESSINFTLVWSSRLRKFDTAVIRAEPRCRFRVPVTAMSSPYVPEDGSIASNQREGFHGAGPLEQKRLAPTLSDWNYGAARRMDEFAEALDSHLAGLGAAGSWGFLRSRGGARGSGGRSWIRHWLALGTGLRMDLELSPSQDPSPLRTARRLFELLSKTSNAFGAYSVPTHSWRFVMVRPVEIFASEAKAIQALLKISELRVLFTVGDHSGVLKFALMFQTIAEEPWMRIYEGYGRNSKIVIDTMSREEFFSETNAFHAIDIATGRAANFGTVRPRLLHKRAVNAKLRGCLNVAMSPSVLLVQTPPLTHSLSMFCLHLSPHPTASHVFADAPRPMDASHAPRILDKELVWGSHLSFATQIRLAPLLAPAPE